ncbi:MAG: N-acetylmuramoyl-L-alanine amidase [Betaproteobacteria bacterium]|jgi:N-acetylmuramoyl-L-alanine amidase|nr:N-acetylmuramoyl-L-alanine amidase [Betaproteobacteria bacterium]
MVARSLFVWLLALPMAAQAAGTIAIDVGHYLDAPGVISAHGRPEFEFNRDLARDIEGELQARSRATHLIGAEGTMNSLPARPRAAAGAALFVAVHHDSMQEHLLSTWMVDGVERKYGDRFEGFSLFVSRENAGWKKGLACASAIGAALIKAGFKPSLYHADPKVGENRAFADKRNGVHYFDRLAVLRNANMPALLFEAGVIVNRAEEKRMADPAVRKRIAAAVSDGIERCMP